MISPTRIAEEVPDYHREAVRIMQASGIDLDLSRGKPSSPDGTYRYDHRIFGGVTRDDVHKSSVGISPDGLSFCCHVYGCHVSGSVLELKAQLEAKAKTKRPPQAIKVEHAANVGRTRGALRMGRTGAAARRPRKVRTTRRADHGSLSRA